MKRHLGEWLPKAGAQALSQVAVILAVAFASVAAHSVQGLAVAGMQLAETARGLSNDFVGAGRDVFESAVNGLIAFRGAGAALTEGFSRAVASSISTGSLVVTGGLASLTIVVLNPWFWVAALTMLFIFLNARYPGLADYLNKLLSVPLGAGGLLYGLLSMRKK